MKVTELRIGNWVSSMGDIVQVAEISPTHYMMGGIRTTPNPIGATHGNNCDPIPLTEDWLKRFGFYKDEDTGLYEHDDLDRMAIAIHGIRYVLAVQDDTGVSYFAYHTKYVHQLQNLYFALTGEELTIKE